MIVVFVALRVSYIDEDEDSTATDSGEDLPIERMKRGVWFFLFFFWIKKTDIV